MTRSILRRNQLSDSFATGVAVLLLILPFESKAGANREDPAYSHPLTLHDCIGIALGESPALEANRDEVASADQEVRAERGKALPNLTGTGGAEAFSGNPTNKFAVVNAGSSSAVGVATQKNVNGEVEVYTARVRYPVFKDGSILGLNNAPAIAEKKAKKRALAWTLNLTRQEVIYRIIDEYITTVSARNRSSLATRRVKLLEQSAAITEQQEKQGLKLPIDVKVARDQLRGARGLAKLLRQQAVAGSLELSRSLGLPSSAELSLAGTLPDPPYPPPTAEQLLGASLSHHPSLERQRALIDEAKQDYRLERYRLYPSVYLDGSAIYLDDFGSSNASAYAGTVTVSVPIFDFGAQLATARSKLMKYKAEEAKLLSTADDVTYEILKAYRSIYILSHNILSLQDDISKLERDVQVIQSQQQQGIAEPLTVIEKELHLLSRQDDLQGLEARRLTLYAVLQKEAGGAWTWIP
jgi:outer membrane protein TolC